MLPTGVEDELASDAFVHMHAELFLLVRQSWVWDAAAGKSANCAPSLSARIVILPSLCDSTDPRVACELSEDGRTAAVSSSCGTRSQAVRGNVPMATGVHRWTVSISQLGTENSFGVVSAHTQLYVPEFCVVVGGMQRSWGITHTGRLWSNTGKGKPAERNGKMLHELTEFRVQENERVTVTLDCDRGTLGYSLADRDFGVVFTDLPVGGAGFYPAVGSSISGFEVVLHETVG
jgi:hypothetical protein